MAQTQTVEVDGRELKTVLFHEGFHRYEGEVMPALPTWANEGLAEVVTGLKDYATAELYRRYYQSRRIAQILALTERVLKESMRVLPSSSYSQLCGR